MFDDISLDLIIRDRSRSDFPESKNPFANDPNGVKMNSDLSSK